MASFTVGIFTDNAKIKELEQKLNCLNHQFLTVAYNVDGANLEIDKFKQYAPTSQRAQARVQELQAKVRAWTREENWLRAEIEKVQDAIKAEAANERRQAQQAAKPDQ